MKLKLSLLLLSIVFSIDILESIEVTDFCQKKELNGIKPECQGFFNISCDSNLCAKKESTCQDINSLFRSNAEENTATDVMIIVLWIKRHVMV